VIFGFDLHQQFGVASHTPKLLHAATFTKLATMLDTIRLVGSSFNTNVKTSVTKYVSYVRDNGTERLAMVHMNDKKGFPYRAFLDPNYNTLTVELNPHKILLNDNIYNYCSSVPDLRGLVTAVAHSFFPYGDCYVSRADLGGVVTYENRFQADTTLEQYRTTKISGARVKKFRHQNYVGSAFYYTKNWSAKVYNKGQEMFTNAVQPEGYPFDLYNTLRFEKTYRSGEFERLGMKRTPFKGVHLHQFDFSAWYEDFNTFFTNWEREAKPYMTQMEGTHGLLHVLDQMGQLDNVAAMGIVNRTTIWRYKNEKKKLLADTFVPTKFVGNLSNVQKNRIKTLHTVGFNPFLQHEITKYYANIGNKIKKAS